MNGASEIGRDGNDRYWGVEGGIQLGNCAWSFIWSRMKN